MAHGQRRNKSTREDVSKREAGEDEQQAVGLKRGTKVEVINARHAVKEKKPKGVIKLEGKARTVKVSSIKPNAWNPNSMTGVDFDRLRKAIRATGFNDPVMVRSGNSDGPFPDGTLEVIDGEHRWRAATAEGLETIPVMDMGNVPDAEAKVLTINANKLRGQHDRTREGEILSELSKLDGGTAILDLMPFSVDERTALISLTSGDFSTVDKMEEVPALRDEDADDDEADGDAERELKEARREIISLLGLDRIGIKRATRLMARLEMINGVLEPEDKPGALLNALIREVMDNRGLEEAEAKG